jgi:hypothetical protein
LNRILEITWRILPVLVLVIVCAGMIAIANTTGNRYRNYRKEIINRLWTEEDAPEEVSSEQISKRLIELNIDVRKR